MRHRCGTAAWTSPPCLSSLSCDQQRLSSPRGRAGHSILKVQEFADVVKVEEGEGGEQSDDYRGGGVRAPFQPPRQEPRHGGGPPHQRRGGGGLWAPPHERGGGGGG